MTGSDGSCYATTTVTDANAHRSQTFSDAFGRTTYSRDLSGNGAGVPYATYRTISATYDYAGNETAITQPNGSATTFSYDDAGRQYAMADPDRGAEDYLYDADGNVTRVTDARNKTVYAGYDGLNRQVWRNITDSPNNAYLSYSYDASGHGDGIGRLTSEQFVSPSDASLTGSYSYTYDARGQVTASTTTLLGANYATATTYDDAGEPLSLTYPDGAVASTSYSQGWLAGVTWTQGGLTTPVLAAVSYSGPAGAFGAITSANVGQNAGAALYRYFGQLDRDGRLVADELVKINTGVMLYDEQIHYDPVGNVSAVTTVLPAGTDNQVFCYDEQNRLTWSGTGAGNPCGNTGATGTFGTAGYTETFSYDTLNRLTNSSPGNYTYGDSAHLHAVTSVSGGNGAYSASYDASGNMQCRAPSSSTACAGTTKTGQALTWDVEGRLSNWQNATTSPTVTAKYLYDGEGNRVVQQVVDSTAGSTTTTSYVGSLATYSITTGNQPTNITTTDYLATGKVLAESVNGTLSYLATSYQGSVVEALDSTGAVGVTASQLYVPYGGIRYASGTLPTDEGYTGQRRDASTGLDYYGARYYDPTVGQFTSADTLLAGGLNRYGYVGGNPTTATDPSGQMLDSGTKLISGNYFLWLCLPTYNPALMPHTSDPDEMTRARTVGLPGFDEVRGALNRTSGGISLSDLPYWNQVSTNRYKAAHPAKTTTTTTTDTPTPPTQPGGDGAGEPPKGPRSPASPASPDDDNGCDCGRIPQGLTQEQFEWLSSTVRAGTAHIGSDDIVVQGSRAAFTARADSDIDLAIRVSSERFEELITERFGSPNPSSAKFRTMEHAIATGKIQAGELGLHGFRNTLESQLGIPVDLSAVRIGGPFDNGEMIPLCHCAGKH